MNIFRRGRAEWIIYKEEDGKKIPQGVIKLSTSGKMTETRVNSITLNSCIGYSDLHIILHNQNIEILVCPCIRRV
jgi:hypothetical protein